MSDTSVHNLASKDAFDSALKNDTLIILDCMATWCGPCKVIAPKIVDLSGQFPNAKFYKLDVDEVPDVAQELGIRAMPTFLIFKNGEKVGEIVGANITAVKAAVEKNYA